MIEEEIRTLLAAPAVGADAPTLALLEHTLTSGYAHALALEAERTRLERRIGELSPDGGAAQAAPRSSELRTLSRRMNGATADLRNLRALLRQLRERASQARAAA